MDDDRAVLRGGARQPRDRDGQLAVGERTAIVLGGGIAGLAAAIALDGAGYRVDIVERAASIEPLGAALSLWGNALSALDALGIAEPLASRAAPISALAVADRDGRPIIAPVAVARAILPTRALLQRSLLDGLGPRTTLHLDSRWHEVREVPGGVIVGLADGMELQATLAIDASGIHSRLADRRLGTRATYRGYGGVLAISAPGEDDGDGCAREYWGRGERFGVMDAGDGRRYWFYMRDAPADAPAPDLATCRVRAGGWPDAVARAVDATDADALIPFAIHARTPPDRLGSGRIMCVGDAAHAMEPNLGQGACLSLEDAAVLGVLARSLAPEAILPAFERRRLPRIRRIMLQSAAAGRLIHGGGAAGAISRRLLPHVPATLHRRQVARTHHFDIPA